MKIMEKASAQAEVMASKCSDSGKQTRQISSQLFKPRKHNQFNTEE